MTGIPVRIIKTFEATRTPCPALGTIGEWYDISGDFYCVRFRLPMVDKDGGRWLTQGDDEYFMRLKFFPDEIALVEVWVDKELTNG